MSESPHRRSSSGVSEFVSVVIQYLIGNFEKKRRGEKKTSAQCTMDERLNTLVCIFDPRSPRISAYDVHEWIHDQLHVREDTVSAIQINGPKRQVFIKFVDLMHAQEVLNATNGQAEYKHTNGEVSKVRVDMAEMGIKRVRVVNLPPETKEEKIRAALSQYGDIADIQKEKWAKAYCYTVDNGIRIVTITLKKHIPSSLLILGHRVLATYEGQPETCYGCGETGHVYVVCPHRRRMERPSKHELTSWASIAGKPPQTQRTVDKGKNEAPNEKRDIDGPMEEE